MRIELARSKNLRLVQEYEVVLLQHGGDTIVVGDHYGDPAGGIIDEGNKWCASYGEGIVVYWLKQPFTAFERATASTQWCEWGRNGQPKQVRSIRQVGPMDIEVDLNEGAAALSEPLRLRIAEGRIDDLRQRQGG